ncbi:MAG: RNA methyltransferase [Flavobacteriales bacterium]|jgi:23S rRNA (guanosine2251-2'-O)-methyltransferase|tara:strand:- start:34 stop:564 length:531 start_codon:yes stop_codon:yes gene_type:complete
MRKLKNSELNRLSVDEFKETQKLPIIVVLDNIRSLNNIGSVFRTSDAFLLEKIYLCGITAQPPHRDIHKTALGATESVDWEHMDNTVDCVTQLQAEGYYCLAIEQAKNSVMLNEFDASKHPKIAVFFGNEVKGVQQEVIDQCDNCIEIPQLGTKHSLNISVSAGVVLWELFRGFRN